MLQGILTQRRAYQLQFWKAALTVALAAAAAFSRLATVAASAAYCAASFLMLQQQLVPASSPGQLVWQGNMQAYQVIEYQPCCIINPLQVVLIADGCFNVCPSTRLVEAHLHK